MMYKTRAKRLRARRGFTLLELAVVLAVVAVFAGIVVWGISRFSSQGAEARASATQYAKDLGLSVKGVSCADKDSDGDGYVSCSISLEGDRVQPTECAVGWTSNSGCRVPKAVAR